MGLDRLCIGYILFVINELLKQKLFDHRDSFEGDRIVSVLGRFCCIEPQLGGDKVFHFDLAIGRFNVFDYLKVLSCGHGRQQQNHYREEVAPVHLS